MNHQELESLAPLYALGTLDGDDLVRFGRHLAECETCRALVAEHERITAELAGALPPERPSPDVFARVLSTVREAPRRRSFSPWPPAAAAGALVAITLGVLLVQARRDVASLEGALAGVHRNSEYVLGRNQALGRELDDRRTELEAERRKLGEALETAKAREKDLEKSRAELDMLEKRLRANDSELARLAKMDALIRDLKTQIFSLAGGGPAKEANGRVFWKGTEILFRPSNLPPLPEKKLYELWMLVPDKDPIPAGLYDASGNVARDFNKIPQAVDRVVGFALTLESQDGSDKPTSALFLAPAK